MVDVTISIVVYRSYEDTKKAIKSIIDNASHSYSYYIYVIDNSCYDDNCKAVVDFNAFIKQYEFIEYINTHQNLGFGKGHNFILNKLNSKYHVIMNPDVLLTEDSFKVLIDFMSDESIGMAIPKIIDDEGNIQPVYRRELTIYDLLVRIVFRNHPKKRYNYHILSENDYTKPFDLPFGQGSFFFVRTDLFIKVGGFDERYFMYVEDADFCKTIRQVDRLVYCPYTSVIHKWEKGSHKSLKLFRMHVQSLKKYFDKYGYAWK